MSHPKIWWLSAHRSTFMPEIFRGERQEWEWGRSRSKICGPRWKKKKKKKIALLPFYARATRHVLIFIFSSPHLQFVSRSREKNELRPYFRSFLSLTAANSIQCAQSPNDFYYRTLPLNDLFHFPFIRDFGTLATHLPGIISKYSDRKRPFLESIAGE